MSYTLFSHTAFLSCLHDHHLLPDLDAEIISLSTAASRRILDLTSVSRNLLPSCAQMKSMTMDASRVRDEREDTIQMTAAKMEDLEQQTQETRTELSVRSWLISSVNMGVNRTIHWVLSLAQEEAWNVV